LFPSNIRLLFVSIVLLQNNKAKRRIILLLMKLMTQVDIKRQTPSLTHRNSVLILGSCFSESIGAKLVAGGFRTDINPTGIVYNPLSVARTLEQIIEGKVYTPSDLFEYGGLWHSFMHHGSFSSSDQEKVLRHINARLKQAHDEFPAVDRLFITFGTAYVYRTLDGEVVSNCHKVPESQFTRTRLEVEEILSVYRALLERCIAANPSLQIVFTVSPIRYVRDGLHESQISKGILLNAVDNLTKAFPDHVHYFPSYEILLDELRDYRFYADDLVHPSSLAVEYIWERFADTYLDSDTVALAKDCESIHKALQHRPLHDDDESYKEFLGQIKLKINRLKEKYPYLGLKLYE
jgi:hypothetical protein